MNNTWFIIFFTLIISVYLTSCSDSSKNTTVQLEQVSTEIQTIKDQWVPDRRLEIFDFSISEDGKSLKGQTSNPQVYQAVQDLASNYPELNIDSFLSLQPMGYGVVRVSVCNFRSNPKHSAELSTQALLGHPLTLWLQEGDWYYVQSPDQYLGWLDKGAFAALSKAQYDDYLSQEKIMYRQDFGFCYSMPDAKSEVVSDLVAGDILTYIAKEGLFYKVAFPDNRIGFVSINQCFDRIPFASDQAPSWASIESTARQFMGRPYLWGGTSGKGIDCSGFTKMVYYLNGLILPRDASQQVRVGKPIDFDEDLSQLLPGDFLFFGTKGKAGGSDRVTHVAIHLGDGKIIHAAQKVQIESLNPAHSDFNLDRRSTLLSARRMIENQIAQTGVTSLIQNPHYAWK